MADEVKIMHIDDSVVRRVDWARESTLARLAELADEQNKYLAKMANETRRQTGTAARATKAAADAAEDFTDNIKDAAKATETYEEKLLRLSRREDDEFRKKWLREDRDNRNLKRSVGDLRTSLSRLERASPIGMFGELTDKIAVAGGRLTDMGGKSAVAGFALTQFSRALTIASFGLGAFAAGVDPFRQMLDSGIAFGGSIEKMQVAVNRTGVGLQDFTRIALQYGTTISGMGGENFSELVRQVQDGTRVFGRYGQSVTAQADSIASFTELLASGGRLYMMNEKERTQATIEYLREQSAVTKLTGISRKRLEEEQKQYAKQASVDLAIRAMRGRGDVAGAEQMLQMGLQVQNILGPEMATAFQQAAMGIVPQGESIQKMLATVPGGIPGFMQMAAGFRDMSPEQMREAILQFAGGLENQQSLDLQALMAQLPRYSMFGAATLQSQILQRSDVARSRTQPQRDEIAGISAGARGVLDAATLGYEQAAGDMARITGDLKATIFTITQQLGIFSAALPAVASLTGAGAGLSGGLLDFVGQGVMQSLGVAGGLVALRMGAGVLARRGIGGAAGALMPALPQMAGPPPPPALAGATGGAAAMGGLRMLGGASILGGLVTGGSEYAQSRNLLKSLFVGGGSLIGTLGGGALGTAALPGAGTLAGGIAGGFVGERAGRALYDAIFGPAAAPGTPAADAAAAAPSVDFGGRFDQLAQRLGRQGPIVMELQNISNLMERMIDGINKVRGAVESR